MFLKLSQYLLIEVIIDWFGSLEITILDSAVCNTELRVLLLDTFSSSAFVHKGCDVMIRRRLSLFNVYGGFNKWIVLRGIKIKSLILETDDIRRSGEFEVLLTDKLQSLTFKRSSSVVYKTDPTSRTLALISTICSELRELSFTFTFLGMLNETSEDQIIKLIRGNMHLRLLEFSYDKGLGNLCLQAISESCKEIQEIYFYHMGPDIDLIHIIQLIKRCTCLKHVILKSSTGKREFLMRNLAEHNVREYYLKLTGFDDASELDKQALVSSLSGVFVLRLTKFSITDAFIMSSLQPLSELQVLNLNSCGCLFSSFALIQLVSQCKKLVKIHLSDCSHFSNIELISILTLRGNRLEYIGISSHDYLDYTTLCAIISANKTYLSHFYMHYCRGVHIDGENSLQIFFQMLDDNKVKFCCKEDVFNII